MCKNTCVHCLLLLLVAFFLFTIVAIVVESYLSVSLSCLSSVYPVVCYHLFLSHVLSFNTSLCFHIHTCTSILSSLPLYMCIPFISFFPLLPLLSVCVFCLHMFVLHVSASAISNLIARVQASSVLSAFFDSVIWRIQVTWASKPLSVTSGRHLVVVVQK